MVAAHSFARRWPDRRWGPFTVTVALGEVNGRLECAGLTLEADRPEKGTVTGAWMRRLPVAELTGEAIADLRRAVSAAQADPGVLMNAGDLDDAFHERRAQFWAGAKTRAGAIAPLVDAGRRRYDAQHFADVAEVYKAALLERGNPTRSVAETFGVSRSAAGKWVARCREKGLLEPTSQGKAAAASKRRRMK